MDGPFAERFHETHPESVHRNVTFKKADDSPHLTYQDTEMYFTTPAQNEAPHHDGLVILKAKKII